MMLDDLSQLIQSRRSIYPATFTDQIIEKDLLIQLLSNANWAPNHRKTEPWRFKIFSGENRQVLADYLAEYYQKNTKEPSALKLKKTREKPLQSSHIIAICMKVSGEEIIPEWEERAAVACAVQNFWLSVTAAGLGGYWSTPKAAIHGRSIFNLKEDEKCLGLFYLGYPKPIALTVPGQRRDINEKLEWM